METKKGVVHGESDGSYTACGQPGGEEASVLSSHHQAVDGLGKDLRVIARSEDGVAEATERTDGGFGLFVQWHPETMTDRAHRNAIYGALVRAAGNRR